MRDTVTETAGGAEWLAGPMSQALSLLALGARSRPMTTTWPGLPSVFRRPCGARPRARNRSQGRPRLRKCHGFETDLGAIVVRQLRKPRSNKINMSSDLRPYTAIRHSPPYDIRQVGRDVLVARTLDIVGRGRDV